MKLYIVPLAPNPTKVMLYLAERAQLGDELPVEQVIVNTLKGHHRAPEHLARNPFGTLPVLELADGSYLRESLSIIVYLDEKFPDGALLSGSIEERAKARDLERTVELQIANPIGIYVHAKDSPIGLPARPKLVAEIEASLDVPLDFIEAQLSDGRPYLFGQSITIADLTLASAFQFLRFIKTDLMGDRPGLRAWDARYRDRPGLQNALKW